MVSGRRPVKRESTSYGSLATPVPSYRENTSTISPKREFANSEPIELSSDENEEEPRSHHGLRERNNIFNDRVYRSPSVSAPPLRTTRQLAAPSIPQPSQSFTSQRRPSSTLAPISSSDPTFAQGMSKVGLKVKLLVDAISDLRKFDLDHVVELPELVLVGDQSAGKSSLMSALTEVQLPRDTGVCTKCPANIRTTDADEWSCKVSLQQYYYYDTSRSRSIRPEQVNRNDPFPPWVEQPLEVKEFIVVNHKNDLEEAIKWAQIALLNHNEDFTLFIPGTGSRALGNFKRERDSTTAKFSPNLIAIDISGPGLPALSFYDLPGIFQTAADPKDQYLKGVIDNLAAKYIAKKNALIIWTLAMKGDPSTSATGKVIMDLHATDRTVGVLTNPDHVYSRHEEYESLLKGEAHVMKHGYFVTRQPSATSNIPKDDGYHAEARHQETEFFNTASLWKDEWRRFSPRFGTKRIQDYLSRELAKQIKSEIPMIRGKIAERTRDVEKRLAQIPDLPDTNIRNIVKTILAEFSNDVCSVMDGQITEELSQWNGLAEQFMDLIRYIKPGITVSHPSDTLATDVIEIDSDDDDVSLASAPVSRKRPHTGDTHKDGYKKQKTGLAFTPKVPASSRFPQTPTHTIKGEINATRIPFALQLRRPRVPNLFAGSVFEEASYLGKSFTDIAGLQAAIQRYLRPGFPGLVDHKTYDFLCTRATKIWQEPLKIVYNQTLEIVQGQLHGILFHHLGVYKQTELYRKAEQHLQQFVDQLGAELKRDLDKLYQRETKQSFTMNRKDINVCMAEELKGLTLARNKIRARNWLHRQVRLEPKKWRYPPDTPDDEKKKIDTKRIDDIVKADELGPDPFALELRVAAYLRGYYMTTATRFSDSVCLFIHNDFFQNIRDQIRFHLEDKLGIDGGPDGEQVCRSLMEEDDTINKIRLELNGEKWRLRGFSDRFARLVAQLQQPDDDTAMGDDNSTGIDRESDLVEEAPISCRPYMRPNVTDIDDEDSTMDGIEVSGV